MPTQRSVLDAIARGDAVEHGLEPDFSPDAVAEAARLGDAPIDDIRVLRRLPWSSIDNVESRDLDQLEVCGESADGLDRLLVAIAEVDALVPRQSALDDHARLNTTSVYTAARVFPMLPESLSTVVMSKVNAPASTVVPATARDPVTALVRPTPSASRPHRVSITR